MTGCRSLAAPRLVLMILRTRLIAIALIAAVAAAAGVVLLWARDGHTASRFHLRSASSSYRLPLQQLDSFAILRTSGPEMPAPALKLSMERAVEAVNFGLLFQFAQRVRTEAGVDAWVIPGRGYMCVLGGRPVVAGCNTTDQTIKNGMSVVAVAPRSSRKRYLLLGLAPDRARAAIVEVNGGRRYRVPIVDNVYAFRASAIPRAKVVW